jgi:hypothetical protein
MEYNPLWGVYVIKSLAKFLDENRGSVPLFVEGFERDTADLPEYIELRVDGPSTRETTKNCWKLYFEVNVLIVVQQNNNNAYRTRELMGFVSTFFVDSIAVHEWEDGEDDPAKIGCLQRVHRGKDTVEQSYFGKIRPDTRIEQGTVEVHYDLYID